MIENYERVMKKTKQIETSRLVLREFSLKDKKDVLEYGSDSDTLKYLIWEGIVTIPEAELSITEYYQSRPGIYAIEEKKSKKCIGAIEYRLVAEHEKAGIGYVLNKKYWNKGYMTEALQAILKFCFTSLELNRVESTHYLENVGSGRVMQKVGMQKEGIILQEVKIKNVFRDVVHYGILKEQWKEEKGIEKKDKECVMK